MHEAQMQPDSCFVTLTYDEQNVPQDYSVTKRDLQLFFKKLRKSLRGKKIRYLACGEYGDQTLRPHYHLLLFNHSFPDKKLHAERQGNRIFKSEKLDTLWGKSQINEIGNLTYQSAAYVARYTLKKINGDRADDHYTRVSPIDGNIYRVEPEFLLWSRGLGQSWFDKYKSDAFPSDFIIVDGKKHKPPTYYLKQLEEDQSIQIKRARKRNANKQRHNNTRERLAVREEIQLSRLSRLKREL